MIKAFMVSLLLFGFLVLLIWSQLFDLLASGVLFYIALGLVIAVLVVAFIILGNPLNRTEDDDKKSN